MELRMHYYVRFHWFASHQHFTSVSTDDEKFRRMNLKKIRKPQKGFVAHRCISHFTHSHT